MPFGATTATLLVLTGVIVRSQPRYIALTTATELVDSGEKLGTQKYPHRYLNRDEYGNTLFKWLRDDCNDADGYYIWEYPTLTKDLAYASGDPGVYRVIFRSDHVDGVWRTTYCGLIAHVVGDGVRGTFGGCDVEYI
ncbi:hypothetical protein E4T43_02114 [Aureobasidium subglaciale]|nr:hypothetical protein E4T43_02114 [Aureobasidium subglaciale]